MKTKEELNGRLNDLLVVDNMVETYFYTEYTIIGNMDKKLFELLTEYEEIIDNYIFGHGSYLTSDIVNEKIANVEAFSYIVLTIYFSKVNNEK